MSEPVFSVIMAAYNAAATIDASIRSVRAQTRGDWELVVVDDGSTDDTAAIVRAHLDDPRVRLLQQENGGLARARNTGIAAARGRYVAFLDSDDLFLPDYLEVYGAALDADPGAAFAYGDSWALDDTVRRIRRATAFARMRPPVPPPATPEAFLLELLRRNFICVMATVRRDVLDRLGPHNPSFRAVEDYELWLRIVAAGGRPVHVPGLHSIVRDRAGSLKKTSVLMAQSQREVYRLVAEEYPDVPEAARALAREQMARYDRIVARVAADARRTTLRTRARLAGGRLKRRVLGRRRFHEPAPPEVAAAFPDLTRL